MEWDLNVIDIECSFHCPGRPRGPLRVRDVRSDVMGRQVDMPPALMLTTIHLALSAGAAD